MFSLCRLAIDLEHTAEGEEQLDAELVRSAKVFHVEHFRFLYTQGEESSELRLLVA